MFRSLSFIALALLFALLICGAHTEKVCHAPRVEHLQAQAAAALPSALERLPELTSDLPVAVPEVAAAVESTGLVTPVRVHALRNPLSVSGVLRI